MNIIKSEHESTLRLEKLVFPKFDFSQSIEKTDCEDLKMRVGRKIETPRPDEINITLSVTIWSADQSMNLDLLAFACFSFSFSEDVPEEVRKEILEKNTVAIMFPYVRSQVSLITTQPDMSPIIIPAININELIESDKNSSKDSKK